jgi:recombination protein RecA
MSELEVLDAFFKGYAKADDELNYHLAHETVGAKVPVISSGSLLLDDILSSGGLPKGRLIQYYGPPGSAKTLMTMLAMKEAQLEDSNARQVFIDAEHTFSPTWAAQLGLDTSRILVVDGDMAANGRRCFEMLLGVPKEDKKTHEYKGKSQEGLLDKVASKELNINMCVLDSIGSIIPPGEDVSKVGKMNISLLARFLTTTFRKLSIEVNRANIPFIAINHKRDNMDPYGADHTFSGGNTYAHTLSANVYFEKVNRKDDFILDEKEERVGGPIRATVEKSKFGPWPKQCEFKVDFRSGMAARHEEIAKLAVDYNIIVKTSTVMHEYGDQKWRGFPAMCEAMKDESLSKEIISKINDAREAKMDELRQQQQVVRDSAEDANKKNNGKRKQKAAE